MVDSVSPELRSLIMGRVRGKDTRPEMVVRRLVFSMGYRYRLHVKDLPGRPDLVFPGKRKVIFVHGCFWHGHRCPMGDRMPKSRVEFWSAKLARNAERDREVAGALRRLGWSRLVIWECQLRDTRALASRVGGFLDA